MTAVTTGPTTHQEPSASLRRRAIMTLGDKGGSSKSFLTRKLAEIHLAAQTPGLLLIDGDESTGSLFKFYGERDAAGQAVAEQSPRGVQVFSLHGSLDARDRLVDDLLQRGSDLIIIDMPATALTKLREINDDIDFVGAVEQAGYRLTILAPITPYDDPILDLQETIALLDPELYAEFTALYDAGKAGTPARSTRASRVDYVAAVNLGMAEDREDFDLWDDPQGFTRNLLAWIGGVELVIPRLRPRIAARLAKHRLAFTAGETSPHVRIMDRSRLRKWNNEAESAFRSAHGVLGF